MPQRERMPGSVFCCSAIRDAAIRVDYFNLGHRKAKGPRVVQGNLLSVVSVNLRCLALHHPGSYPRINADRLAPRYPHTTSHG
jgi:hypothetical protein